MASVSASMISPVPGLSRVLGECLASVSQSVKPGTLGGTPRTRGVVGCSRINLQAARVLGT